MSFPIASMNPNKDEITGSIKPAVETEDHRRARAALATALDPQGAGTLVKWDNPTSRRGGSFVPLGQAYAVDGRVCRAYRATEVVDAVEKTSRATACMTAPGEWATVDAKKKA